MKTPFSYSSGDADGMLRSRTRRLLLMCALGVLWHLTPTPCHATLIVADFNDITTGVLNGKGGGTGLSGTWGGSTLTSVVASDLSTALYTLTQSGTAQRVQGASSGATNSQTSRALTTNLSGSVWFSFLLRNSDAVQRGAVTLNDASANFGASALDFVNVGSEFRVRRSGGTNLATAVSSLNTTHLVLGRLIVDGSGSDELLTVWFDPDVTNASVLGDLGTPLFDGNVTDLVSSVSRIGVASYGGTGGIVDHLRFSDTQGSAITEVSGLAVAAGPAVPEPNTFTLAVFGAALLASRRRRKPRRNRSSIRGNAFKTAAGLGVICIVLATAGTSLAVTISVDAANFARTEGAGTIATSYTGASHVGLEYIGATDFLSTAATFEIQFTTGAASTTGAALWFGQDTNAQWVFASEETTDQLRHFSGRILTTHASGTLNLLDSGSLLSNNTTYRLVASRTLEVGLDRTLDVELFQGLTSVSGIHTINYTAPLTDAWGVTVFSGAGRTILINSVSATTATAAAAVPEPGTLVLAAMGLLLLGRRSRRR